MSRKHGAIFLDRDGTIIDDVGPLHSEEDIRLFPDTVAALRRLQSVFPLFVVTNQCWIGEGVLTRADIDSVHQALEARLQTKGVRINDWYVCPHARDATCECRKPAPGLLRRAAREHTIDLAASFIVGDHPADVLTGNSDGVRGAYVLTGHGRKHQAALPETIPVFQGISGAVRWILKQVYPAASADRMGNP